MDQWMKQARDLVEQMTIKEQATLMSGDGWWQTNAIARVGLPAITMADGPHGLRKAKPGHSASAGESALATCFPTASALAATWNPALVGEVGAAIADEARALDVHILLGPGVNIKRSPLGGRNFEYFSEDPLLSGVLAAAYIDGVQQQGVGTSLKHYAVNSQETERMVSSSDVDEATLHEIYLSAFEIAVRQARPWTVMAAYNKVNGIYATEHAPLLTDILRRRWGFDGFVVSDWGAIDDRVAAVAAGTNLEMPGSGDYNQRKIVAAVQAGQLPREVLARSAAELVRIVLMAHAAKRPGVVVDHAAHDVLARRVAGEAIVLLKNDDGVLPLQPEQRISVIGAFAAAPRFQGAGSSQVNPVRVSSGIEALKAAFGDGRISFSEGCDAGGDTSEAQLEQAVAAAARADVAVIFAGLPDSYESEGFDRSSIDLPPGQQRLIEAVAQAQPNLVVVLHNGSPVAMPWLGRVKGVVEAWLGGQAGGAAVADVLSGAVNPSGKLAETFPVDLQQTATYHCFPGLDRRAIYGEGLFVGYRHYDARSLTPLFPFGFGLSYTRFEFVQLRASALRFDASRDDAEILVEVDVRNAGSVAGQEVVQLYVGRRDAGPQRPPRALRAFEKLTLAQGECGTARLRLTWRDFAHYDATLGDWRVEPGTFQLHAGSSSRDLPLQADVTVDAIAYPSRALSRQSMVGDFLASPGGDVLYRQLVTVLGFGELLDDNVSDDALSPQERVGRRKRRMAMLAIARTTPIGKVPALSCGKLSDEMLDQILNANGTPIA